jgi:glycosyltransferase involved in cell wall biosynthesis
MTKILRILNRLNIGGPTYNVAYLSSYLGEQYKTKVLAGIKEPYEGSSEYVLQELGIDYELVPHMMRQISLKQDLRAYRYISQTISTFKPDIVHTHAAKAGALGRLAAHFSSHRPKAIVHTYHGNVFDGYFSPIKTKVFLGIERYLCAASDAIVAISEKQRKDLAEVYKIAPADKIHVIPLGFDLDRFTKERELKRDQFRREYAVDDDTLVVTITGRLTAIKNHALFFDAARYVKQEHPHLKVKYFVVGDGELFDNLTNRAVDDGFTISVPGKENATADVVFTSWRKDIDTVNAGSDIIVLTSFNEGTPVSIIEALASKKAVIATDVGGVGDVVKDNLNGLLSPIDPKFFSVKFLSLLTDPHLRNRLAGEGEQGIFKSYSYHRLISDMENLYENLLKNK